MRLDWVAADTASTSLVITDLRPEDYAEVYARSGTRSPFSVDNAIMYGVRQSEVAKVGYPDFLSPYPVALWGILRDPLWPDRGVVWLLATKHVKKHALSLIRDCEVWIKEMRTRFPQGLHNYIDSRNDLHIRWVEALGFEVHRDRTQTWKGVPFYYFEREYV